MSAEKTRPEGNEAGSERPWRTESESTGTSRQVTRGAVERDPSTKTVTGNVSGRCAVSVTAQCQQCRADLTRVLNIRLLGEWTQHYRAGARYCSNACRQKAYRQRRSGWSA